mmetsp:Transcript_3028/g.4708  ORF Transcript_3028/g.4708 Transcript_3028/m.4708 type:complete len:130 (+) Transcript_3028:660-1049(+)
MMNVMRLWIKFLYPSVIQFVMKKSFVKFYIPMKIIRVRKIHQLKHKEVQHTEKKRKKKKRKGKEKKRERLTKLNGKQKKIEEDFLFWHVYYYMIRKVINCDRQEKIMNKRSATKMIKASIFGTAYCFVV